MPALFKSDDKIFDLLLTYFTENEIVWFYGAERLDSAKTIERLKSDKNFRKKLIEVVKGYGFERFAEEVIASD